MAVLRVWSAFELESNGVVHRGGSKSAPVEVTVDAVVSDQQFTLATATSQTVWTSASPPTNFDYFWLLSDQALKLELTVDRGGEVGLEEIVFVHPANKPFQLHDDAALALYSGTLSGGTADVIDEIVIRNESGTTANVRAVLVT